METNEKKRTAVRRRAASGSTKTNTAKRSAASASAKRSTSAVKSASAKRSTSTVKSAASTKRRTSAAAARRKKQLVAPEVVYTPAQPFDRGRLLLQLVTIVAVVLALTFGMSIFFKVEVVTVSGNEKYDSYTVWQASGIQEGDNLLSFSKARAGGQIKAKLPYVDTVRIGIKLPNTVNIVIEEWDVLYCVKDSAGLWWLITSEGDIIDQVDGATAGEYTQLVGITLDSPAVGGSAKAVEPLPQTNEAGEVLPVTVLASEQLSTALTIVQYLESESIIGEVTSVDVSDLGDLELWYGQQYQVELGDTTQLGYKISCMNQAVKQLDDYESGEIDVSFTIIKDQPMYTRFSETA